MSEKKEKQQQSYTERWRDALKKVIKMHKATFKRELDEIAHYFVHVKHEEVLIDRKLNLNASQIDLRRRSNRTLGFWCFNPGLGFRKLESLKPRALVLTSGTLTPLKSFELELMASFPVKIENGHVVTR